jgi:hypothetical protein
MKKYLQRCKGYLSDKQALYEMNVMTLDATHTSMKALYEDTLKSQDALIAKLKSSGEFDGIDLEEVELANWKALSEADMIELGPSATLNALRGLPINDSVRMMKKKELSPESEELETNGVQHEEEEEQQQSNREDATAAGNVELYIETKDDNSVHSEVSDPDEDFSNGDDVSDHEDDQAAAAESVPPSSRQKASNSADSDLTELATVTESDNVVGEDIAVA